MQSVKEWLASLGLISDMKRQPKSLFACSSVLGASLVVPDRPSFDTYYNVSVLPCAQNVGLRDDFGWGVFDSNSNLIDAAALKIGAGIGLIGQRPTMIPSENLEWELRTGDDYIYGGSINAHFGHFVCSSLSRLWWLGEQDIGLKRIVFHSPGDFFSDIKRDFIASCLGSLGISTDNAEVITRPTKFERLVVPGPSMEEQSLSIMSTGVPAIKLAGHFGKYQKKRNIHPHT